MGEFVTQTSHSEFPGFWHVPVRANGHGVVLTHGAGSNAQSVLLVSFAERLCRSGAYVLRYDLPFRQQRPTGPPHGNGAGDRAGLAQAAAEVRKLASGAIYLAGHSYGGRQASILAAEQQDVCDGLLLLSYPLHPPKQPLKLRTEHFPRITVPVMFVHGSNDPFGSIDELSTAVTMIPSPTTIMIVEKARHDLRTARFDVSDQAVGLFHELMIRKGQLQTIE